MSQDIKYAAPAAQRSGDVVKREVLFDKEFAGLRTKEIEFNIPQGQFDDLSALGIGDLVVINDRNSAQSRESRKVFTPDDAETFEVTTAEDGTEITTRHQIVARGTALPAAAVQTLKRTADVIDGNHDKQVIQEFGDFPAIVSYEQASEQLGGLDIKITKQRVEFAETLIPGEVADHTYELLAFDPTSFYDSFQCFPTMEGPSGFLSELFITMSPPVVTPTFTAPNLWSIPASSTIDGIVASLCDVINTVAGWNAEPVVGLPSQIRIFSDAIGTDTKFTFTLRWYDLVGSVGRDIFGGLNPPGYAPLVEYAGTEDSYIDDLPGDENVEALQYIGETLERQQRVAVEDITETDAERDTLEDFIPEMQADVVTKTVGIVDTGAEPTLGYLDIACQQKKVAVGSRLRTTFSTNAFVPFTDWIQDEETQRPVRVVRTIYDAATYTEPAVVAGVEVTAKQIDKLRVLETRLIASDTLLGFTKIETKNIQYRFPGWLKPGAELHIGPVYLSFGGDPIEHVNGLNMRPGQTLTVPSEMWTTWHPTEPIAPAVFQFLPSSITAEVDRSLLQLSSFGPPEADADKLLGRNSLTVSELISNEVPIVYESDCAAFVLRSIQRNAPEWLDTYFANPFTHTVVISIPESLPNATDYEAMMAANTRVMIGVEIVQQKYNLWRQTRTYIAIPDLRTP